MPTPDILGDVLAATNTAGMLPENVPLKQIKPNPYQSRSQYANIEELALDIERNGLLQPAVGRRVGLTVELAIGHRRWMAIQWLNDNRPDTAIWSRMPVVIKPLADDTMARIVWSENHQRDNISPVDEARHMQRMIEEFGFTQEEVAEELGLSRSVVANKVRLLKLPETAIDLLQQGKITERHGRELLRLSDVPTWLDGFVTRLKDQVARDSLEAVSVLSEAITSHIRRNSKLMSKEALKDKDLYGIERPVEPPEWPWDYAPRSELVVGPCEGCAQLIQFPKDPAPRCVNSDCREKKRSLWIEKEKERQREAALAAANAAVMPAPVDRKPAEQPARAIERIDYSTYGVHRFRNGDSDAPAALIEHGICSKQQCDCFCLSKLDEWSRSSTRRSEYVHPDPKGAPDIVYACSNGRNLAARRRRLEAILEPEKAEAENRRRADLASQTRQSKQILQELWNELGAATLMHSKGILLSLVAGAKPEMTIDEIWEQAYWNQATDKCRVREYRNGDFDERWDLPSTQRWVARVRQELSMTQQSTNGSDPSHPKVQPGPGDSQRTNWQDGWEDEDQGTWLIICAGLQPLDPDLLYRPRVLLRAIEETKDKDIRGALWRRYNQLIPQETNQQ